MVVFPAQKRNSNFWAEYIYGIRTDKHTLHLIYFIDFQRFIRFTYNKSETFYLFFFAFANLLNINIKTLLF